LFPYVAQPSLLHCPTQSFHEAQPRRQDGRSDGHAAPVELIEWSQREDNFDIPEARIKVRWVLMEYKAAAGREGRHRKSEVFQWINGRIGVVLAGGAERAPSAYGLQAGALDKSDCK
jgi:hypothetical protein